MRFNTKPRIGALRVFVMMLSVALIVTMMPINIFERAHAADSEEAFPAFSQQVKEDGVSITVNAPEGAFPKDANLSIEKINQEEQKKVNEAVDKVRPDGTNPALSYTYDIKVLDADGQELQPADGKKVEIVFALAPAADENLKPAVYGITEITDGEEAGELAAEALESEVNEKEETVTVETDGLSLYTVEFTYEDKQYDLQGAESVPFSEILEKVGLSGEVKKAEVSSEKLFSVSEKNGEWTLTSHKSFDTEEWLKVTIGDAEYVITLTDDGDAEAVTRPGEEEAASNTQKRASGAKSLPAGVSTRVTFSYGDETFVKYFGAGENTVDLSDICSALGLSSDSTWFLSRPGVLFVDSDTNEEISPKIFDVSEGTQGDKTISFVGSDTFTEVVVLQFVNRFGQTISITATNGGTLGASSWDGLQNAINMTPDNTPRTIILREDIKNDNIPNKDAIVIPNKKKITIDLNGKTLDGGWFDYDPRGLRNYYAGENRHVLQVNKGAELTVTDSGGETVSAGEGDDKWYYDAGTIRGGCANQGGGIFVSKGAKCTIEGGTIRRNGAREQGAGIYTEGTLEMTGGAIIDNLGFDDKEKTRLKEAVSTATRTGR